VSQIASKMPKLTRGVWLLMNDTGLRVSDAIRVKYADIDNYGYLHYIAKKTKKNGRAKLSDAFLSEFIGENRADGYVFRSTQNPQKHVSRATVFRHIKKACLLCGINPEGIAPHSARKSFAVRDFREFGLGRVMHDLQHRDASTTLLYAMSDNAIEALYKELRKLQAEMMSLSDKLDSQVKEITEKLDILFNDVRGDKLNIRLLPKPTSQTSKKRKNT